MNKVAKELMNENNKMLEYYSRAKEIWTSIDITDKNLSKKICNRQHEFEQLCRDRNLGQKIMVYSGIKKYIDTSDNQSAIVICDAFINGNCCNEVKQLARKARLDFNL